MAEERAEHLAAWKKPKRAAWATDACASEHCGCPYAIQFKHTSIVAVTQPDTHQVS
jgi:hypothetical protein